MHTEWTFGSRHKPPPLSDISPDVASAMLEQHAHSSASGQGEKGKGKGNTRAAGEDALPLQHVITAELYMPRDFAASLLVHVAQEPALINVLQVCSVCHVCQ